MWEQRICIANRETGFQGLTVGILISGGKGAGAVTYSDGVQGSIYPSQK